MGTSEELGDIGAEGPEHTGFRLSQYCEVLKATLCEPPTGLKARPAEPHGDRPACALSQLPGEVFSRTCGPIGRNVPVTLTHKLPQEGLRKALTSVTVALVLLGAGTILACCTGQGWLLDGAEEVLLCGWNGRASTRMMVALNGILSRSFSTTTE